MSDDLQTRIARLEKVIKEIPEEKPIWIRLYGHEPKVVTLPQLREGFDRHGDLVTQITEHLTRKGYRDNMMVQVQVCTTGKGGELAASLLPIGLPPRELAPPPPPPRAENPASAVDANKIVELAAQLKAAKVAIYGACKDCGEPRPECTCEDTCGDCGLVESKCQCSDGPDFLAVVAQKVATGTLLDDVSEGITDILRAGASRLRHGTQPREVINATVTSVRKTGAA